MDTDAQIAAIRRFNRFYTREIGVLEEGLQRSRFSLTEARVLHEVAAEGAHSAKTLIERLALDPGYVSRILKRFEDEGLVLRTPDPEDGRASRISLTAAGRAAYDPLDTGTRAQMRAMLGRLAADDRTRLVDAMRTIEGLLAPTAPAPIVLRDPRPGDMGAIVSAQARLYAEEYGWDERFEALVARIVADFVDQFQPGKERCWIADRDGSVVGSVFLVRQDDETAKLRLLYVDRTARGQGLGARLTDACIAFARSCGYRRLTLWTNDVLAAARHIYESRGFVLESAAPHTSFGRRLVGQTWTLDLTSPVGLATSAPSR